MSQIRVIDKYMKDKNMKDKNMKDKHVKDQQCHRHWKGYNYD